MSDAPQRFFEFENFLLDSQQRLVFRDGEPLDLTPKVFDVLLELVESGGRVVEKKELMESVWPDSFVEESNLTQHVSTLRKKLGQDGAQRMIVTVPGRGYRFVTPVRSWDDDAVVTVHERVRSRVTLSDTPAIDVVQAPAKVLPHDRSLNPSRALVVLIVATSVLIAGAALYIRYLRRPGPAFANIKLTRFTTDGKVVTAAISPNGKQVAYAQDENGRHSLWVRQVSTANTGVQIIGPATWRYNSLTFSPDNDYVYFTAQEINAPVILYRVPALGGNPAKLIEDIDSAVTFSADGKRMAFLRGYPDANETAVFIANIDGSGETKLTSLRNPRIQINLGPGPAWSPDGEAIVCSVSESSDSDTHQEVYTVNARSGEVKPLTRNKWFRVFRMAWADEGQGVLMSAADSETGVLQVWYVSYPSGEARRVTNELIDYRSLTLTSDSQTAAVVRSDEQSNVWAGSAEAGNDAVEITTGNYDGFDGLSWTPDGRILFSAARNGLQDIWITDVAGKQKAQLTENAGQNISPSMSPDGHTIVFASSRDGKQRIWRMNADGSSVQRLTDGQRDTNPVLTPDSQWIIYLGVLAQGAPELLKVSINGGAPTSLLSDGLPGAPAISPDGKTIAFAYRKPALAKQKIALLPVDGSSEVKVLDSKDVPRRSQVRWLNDGHGIAYVKVGGNVSNLWVQPIDNSASRQLTNFSSDLIYNFAFSSNGRLAISRGRQTSDVVLISSVR